MAHEATRIKFPAPATRPGTSHAHGRDRIVTGTGVAGADAPALNSCCPRRRAPPARPPRTHHRAPLVRLIPRDERFFDMFAALAQQITASVTLLHELFRNPDRIGHFEKAIKDVEHEADGLVHQVHTRIDSSFVTPLDREDIHLLATRLDNVVDLIDGTARRATMFGITETRNHALLLTDVLVRAAKMIEASVKSMRDPQAVADYGRKIKALEEEGDQIYHEAVGALFRGSGDARPDPIEVIKWKELFDKLEETMDECDDVSNVLESISLKNS
jgi:uncharacterized protein